MLTRFTHDGKFNRQAKTIEAVTGFSKSIRYFPCVLG